jgi:lipoprotein-anchoring transpeptidase ErfK/SrfK
MSLRNVRATIGSLQRALLVFLIGAFVAAEPASAEPGRCAGLVKKIGSGRVAYAAVVERVADTYRVPGRGFVARFSARNVNRYPTVFGVRGVLLDRDCRPRWYRVQLPMRPNGAVGYVRARSVTIGSVATRIIVELSSRRVMLFRRGKMVLRARAAVGTAATPTPRGRFYVNQRLIPRDPSGPYGPGAIGISAFSPVLTGWAQGGPVAIHGTNQPWLIGRRVTNGCIRLHNRDLRRLFRATPAGTPVWVRR